MSVSTLLTALASDRPVSAGVLGGGEVGGGLDDLSPVLEELTGGVGGPLLEFLDVSTTTTAATAATTTTVAATAPTRAPLDRLAGGGYCCGGQPCGVVGPPGCGYCCGYGP